MRNLNAYYINVFRDEHGNIRESEDGIMDSRAKAELEAIHYELDHGWTYIDTLSNQEYLVDFRQAIEAEGQARDETEEDDRRYGTYQQQVAAHYDSVIR